MTPKIPDNDTWHRILDAAENLFAQRGYAAVRLRDISAEVGIKHSALYYYMPDGKEQLYVEVMRRSLNRHREGMESAIHAGGNQLREQLIAVGEWLLAQPPMNVARMEMSDFTAISPTNAVMLSSMIFDLLRLPVRDALSQAAQADLIQFDDLDLAAISFIILVQSIQTTSVRVVELYRREILRTLVDMLLQGWLKR